MTKQTQTQTTCTCKTQTWAQNCTANQTQTENFSQMDHNFELKAKLYCNQKFISEHSLCSLFTWIVLKMPEFAASNF